MGMRGSFAIPAINLCIPNADVQHRKSMIAETTATAARPFESAAAPAAATVLLVDDDAAVRDLVTRLLKLHHYRVIAVESGRAALPTWHQHRNEIDLLLTDVVMPDGISGRELARRCQSEKPALRVIYTSGYNVEISMDRGQLSDTVHFLQKPYRPEQLLKVVADVLIKAPHLKKEPHVESFTG
jgi:CheY-like chemotaxis protein